ncbi:MAG: hypothetical protein ACLRQA_10260 [Anaerovoracaceae bacterium]|uniref:hypothetical protein n=1 Tax=Gallibacter sp. Marseille-QA0791 TaxID=3378781 RepID=UPI003A3EA4BE
MNSLIFTKKGIVYSIIFFVMFPLCFQCALLVERGEDSLHEIMWDVSWASYLLGIWPLISGVLAGTYMIVMMALHRKLSASCPAGRWISLGVVVFNGLLCILPFILAVFGIVDVTFEINIFFYPFSSLYCMLVVMLLLFIIVDILRNRKKTVER